MGSGQSTVSAGKLLARASKSPGSESLAAARSLPPREVRSRLAKLGVVPDQDDSPEELARALATAQDPDYWVANWELHPNSGRVKNWLWVHSRFREYFAELVKEAELLEAAPPESRPNNAKHLLAPFIKFAKKVTRHSLFEDEQLFKYFAENHGVDFSKLSQQHADLRATEAVRIALTTIAGGKTGEEVTVKEAVRETEQVKRLSAAVHDMHKEFINHLALEEKTIVPLWLNLTNEEYRKYRTYLSWKFSAMY
mmetsp:Transcript_28332/g.72832  ORF Transcript_28332/g.72832 Transcript_28332/m.72832 type:complete len:253 (-) Transcript_28332:203-961(-)